MTVTSSLAAGRVGRQIRLVTTPAFDPESADWLRDLAADSARREATVDRLRQLLLRVARGEASRRRASLPDRGIEEVDDLCHQAATDAVLAILAKLSTFRGEARFTTWACKFVIFEISTRLRRHAWRHRQVATDDAVWETVPSTAPLALTAIARAETLAAVDRAIREDLTARQRLVFTAAVLDEVPIDVLAERLKSSRGAIYKILHDARAKLRRTVAGAGHQEASP